MVDDGDRELGGRGIVARPAEARDGERLPSHNILGDECLAVVVVDIQQKRQRALAQVRHRLQRLRNRESVLAEIERLRVPFRRPPQAHSSRPSNWG